MKKAIISPPFGNYIERDWATSVKGTYTLDRRWGLWWKVLTTLRKTKKGWVNRIGLRNKGLKNLNFVKLQDENILSVAGITPSEWMDVIEFLDKQPIPHYIEVNAMCPNTGTQGADFNIFWMAVSSLNAKICVKVTPTYRGTVTIEEAYRAGVRTFHISNSYPTERGGLSGPRIKSSALHLINWTKSKYYDVTIIGGGGIYTPQDVRDYRDAGADHFSLSTIWFTPSKVEAVKEEIYEANGSTY